LALLLLLDLATTLCRWNTAGRPGKEVLDDWRSSAESAFAKYDRHLEISTDEIKVSGEMAFERGLVKGVLKPKSGGEAVTEEHRFLDVWQRRNGQWKIVQAMSNK
jgi:ketosteroid isomerase-like protein